MVFDGGLGEEAIQEGSRIQMQTGVGVNKHAALVACGLLAGMGGSEILSPRNDCVPGPAFAHKQPQHGETMLPGEGRRRNKKKQRWAGRRQ